LNEEIASLPPLVNPITGTQALRFQTWATATAFLWNDFSCTAREHRAKALNTARGPLLEPAAGLLERPVAGRAVTYPLLGPASMISTKRSSNSHRLQASSFAQSFDYAPHPTTVLRADG
jgi:hypothetical protein